MKKQLLLLALLVCSSAFAQETVYQAFEVDSAAQPRGGIAYLNTFLQVNLRKPIAIESKGIGGRVIVSGIVDADGHVANVKAIPSKYPELDREAVRVFRLFNAWQPAQKGGKGVRQQVNYPVTLKATAPFAYVDNARTLYFDADRNPVSEGSEQARYKQVAPVDTNGLPSADIIIYKAKGTNWKVDHLLPLVRQKNGQRSPRGISIYLIGYQNQNRQWQGNVFGTDGITLINQAYYDNGQRTGAGMTYHANGSIAERTDETGGKKTVTSWYPNGQVKQVGTAENTQLILSDAPEQVTAFWDSTGDQLVRNGNGQAVYSEMRDSQSDTTHQTAYIEQGRYVNGFKQDVWTGRYADGSYFYEEQYDKGVCKGGKARTAGSDTVRYAMQSEQPEFKGGMDGLGRFLSQNLRYPADAQRAGIQGKVYISFVVCTDGTLCDYEILKGINSSVDQEALRVVKAMSGRWKPGVQRGQKVRVKYNLPINFALQ